ncbi:MAG: PEP-CTERM sorting domain-containing protein, partial [Phycisphaerae bacterium]|nr:PEP-CTERM sorting domain-containing protein [Phycisphaerae bacterium]
GVPGTITGNVINGVISSGDVVGPVPEPATMGLLALGGLALLRRRHKRM